MRANICKYGQKMFSTKWEGFGWGDARFYLVVLNVIKRWVTFYLLETNIARQKDTIVFTSFTTEFVYKARVYKEKLNFEIFMSLILNIL